MIIADLLKSEESKTLEFKRNLSSPRSLLITLVAFANTAGGLIIIGVADATHEPVGVDNPLDEEERLCNLIADSISPRLVPNVELTTVEGKTLLVVEVFLSSSRPHYLCSEGPEKGVYVRLGSTNRQADRELIAELRRSVEGVSFDELPIQYQKEVWPGSTLPAPVPIVMVTTQTPGGKPNICTVAWIGIVCRNLPMLSISLQPSRHSFSHLMEQKEFVVNLPPRHLARETDMCGVISGRDEDKFEKTHLTPVPAKDVLPPLIRECPVNLECRVTKVIELGSHHLFIAEIVRVHVQKKLINETGRLALEKARLLSYAHGHYYAIGIRIGRYGFSVRKHHPDEIAPARKEKKLKKKLERETAREHDRPREKRYDRYEDEGGRDERHPRQYDRDDRAPRDARESRHHDRQDRAPRCDGGVWRTEEGERRRSDYYRAQGEDRPRRPKHHDDQARDHDRPPRQNSHDERAQGDDRPRRAKHHDDRHQNDKRSDRSPSAGRDRARERVRERVSARVRSRS